MSVKIVTSDVAKRIDLQARKDNTLNIRMIFTQSDGTALDLTTFTSIEFEVIGNGNLAVLSAATGGTGITVSGTGNNVLTIVKADTDMSFNAGTYSWQITGTKVDYKKEWVNGRFFFTESTTDITQGLSLEGTTIVQIEGEKYNVTISNPV